MVTSFVELYTISEWQKRRVNGIESKYICRNYSWTSISISVLCMKTHCTYSIYHIIKTNISDWKWVIKILNKYNKITAKVSFGQLKKR